MRYTIGCRIEDKTFGQPIDGIFASNSYVSFVLNEWGEEQEKRNNESKNRYYRIFVFDDINLATVCAQSLSRAYRRDDVARDPSKKSKKIRKFYPVKVDSTKFPYTIEIKEDGGEKKLNKDRFNKEVRPFGKADIYYVTGLKEDRV